MNDEQVYPIEGDVKTGMIAQRVMKRGFPRFWRKWFLGVAPMNSRKAKDLVGVVLRGGKKGEEATIMIRGVVSFKPETPVKLTRWQRLKRWLAR